MKKKEKEPEPIPPPTHIAQSYDEYILSLARKRNSTRGNRLPRAMVEPDPFGIKNDLPTLRKDKRIIDLIVTKDEIEKELKNINPPDQNEQFNDWAEQIHSFSAGVDSFSDKLLYPSISQNELPFYIDTPQHKRMLDQIRAEAMVNAAKGRSDR